MGKDIIIMRFKYTSSLPYAELPFKFKGYFNNTYPGTCEVLFTFPDIIDGDTPTNTPCVFVVQFSLASTANRVKQKYHCRQLFEVRLRNCWLEHSQMFELDINEDDIRLRKRHPITSTPPRDNSHANHSKPWRLSPTPPRTHSTPSPERERGRRPRRKLPSDRSNERIVRESSNHDERIRKPSDSGAESGHSARRDGGRDSRDGGRDSSLSGRDSKSSHREPISGGRSHSPLSRLTDRGPTSRPRTIQIRSDPKPTEHIEIKPENNISELTDNTPSPLTTPIQEASPDPQQGRVYRDETPPPEMIEVLQYLQNNPEAWRYWYYNTYRQGQQGQQGQLMTEGQSHMTMEQDHMIRPDNHMTVQQPPTPNASAFTQIPTTNYPSHPHPPHWPHTSHLQQHPLVSQTPQPLFSLPTQPTHTSQHSHPLIVQPHPLVSQTPQPLFSLPTQPMHISQYSHPLIVQPNPPTSHQWPSHSGDIPSSAHLPQTDSQFTPIPSSQSAVFDSNQILRESPVNNNLDPVEELNVSFQLKHWLAGPSGAGTARSLEVTSFDVRPPTNIQGPPADRTPPAAFINDDVLGNAVSISEMLNCARKRSTIQSPSLELPAMSSPASHDPETTPTETTPVKETTKCSFAVQTELPVQPKRPKVTQPLREVDPKHHELRKTILQDYKEQMNTISIVHEGMIKADPSMKALVLDSLRRMLSDARDRTVSKFWEQVDKTEAASTVVKD
ncbi:uncharacterized protein LOC135346367 isoform X2 [Halichondria panicea]|uniref:uncharacterized protein LOC135346367 isoform X2 n=1 Tax=Halichondria panicea TaxID=6063 RepID=UPI00312B8925